MTADLLPETENSTMTKRKNKVNEESVIDLVHIKFGRPARHFRTDAHHIHRDNWRVNVWVSVDDDCLMLKKKIERSYFLSVIENNGVLEAYKVW